MGELVTPKQAPMSLDGPTGDVKLVFDCMLELLALHEIVLDGAGVAVDYRILDCNAAFCRVTGIPRERAVGGLATDVYETGAAPYLDVYARVAATGEPVRFDTYFAPMGKHFSISAFPAGPGRFGTCATDVTARVRAESALAVQKERLAVTLRSIGDAVIATDIDARVSLWNEAAEVLTGTPSDAAMGEPLAGVLRLVLGEAGAAGADPVTRVLSTGEVAVLEEDVWLVVPGGAERGVTGSAAPIRDASEKIVGVVLVLRDVTRERRRESVLARTQRLEALAAVAAGMAHDFNNFLSGILTNVSLARVHPSADDDLRQMLVEAEGAAMRARGLAQQLLTFAKGEPRTGRPHQLAQLLREATLFCAHGFQGVCRFELGRDLRAVGVEPEVLTQLLQNLVINAIDAMPGGGAVTVGAENARLVPGNPLGLPPGPYLSIRVADEGVGIAEADLPRIFDPYFSTKSSGSGLGLAVTRALVKKHGGAIEVASRPGEGTTFILHLPAAEDPAAVDHALERVQAIRGARVLVMDDDETIRRVAVRVLAGIGFETTAVSDGRDAVAAFREASACGRPFDLVIVDLTVPGGMGGVDTLAELRRDAPAVDVILSSGYYGDPAMTAFREHGFVATLRKPYVASDLAETVTRIVADQRARRGDVSTESAS